MVESNVRTIKDLDKSLPAKSDYISEGDDHIRLIKTTLINAFPNADTNLTAPFSQLSKVTDYMSFKRDSNDSYNIIEFDDKTLLSNVVDSDKDSDVASVGKVKALITALISDKLYRVGSYYFSDVNTNPKVALGMASSVQWLPVSGFLAGIGTVGGGLDGGTPDTYTFEAGDTNKGAHKVKLTVPQLPRVTMDGSGLYTSTDAHSHTTQFDAYQADGNSGNRGGELAGQVGRGAGGVGAHNYTSTSYSHFHQIQGTVSFGSDANTQLPVSVVPRHTGVYIWKRVS